MASLGLDARAISNRCASAPTATRSPRPSTSSLAYCALARADADRPHRRGRAADRLGPGLPDLAEVLRQRLPAAEHPRGDRVLQPRPDRARSCSSPGSPGSAPCAAGPTGAIWSGWAGMLPLGVVGQAVLGGFTVKGALDYGWVMGHFAPVDADHPGGRRCCSGGPNCPTRTPRRQPPMRPRGSTGACRGCSAGWSRSAPW